MRFLSAVLLTFCGVLITSLAQAGDIQMLPPTALYTSTVCSGGNQVLAYSGDDTQGHAGINCVPVTVDGGGSVTTGGDISANSITANNNLTVNKYLTVNKDVTANNNLTVQGIIKLGAASVGGACGTIGTLAYDYTSNLPVTCNGSVWTSMKSKLMGTVTDIGITGGGTFHHVFCALTGGGGNGWNNMWISGGPDAAGKYDWTLAVSGTPSRVACLD